LERLVVLDDVAVVDDVLVSESVASFVLESDTVALSCTEKLDEIDGVALGQISLGSPGLLHAVSRVTSGLTLTAKSVVFMNCLGDLRVHPYVTARIALGVTADNTPWTCA
jgi:hypothetical protein